MTAKRLVSFIIGMGSLLFFCFVSSDVIKNGIPYLDRNITPVALVFFFLTGVLNILVVFMPRYTIFLKLNALWSAAVCFLAAGFILYIRDSLSTYDISDFVISLLLLGTGIYVLRVNDIWPALRRPGG